MQIRGLSKKFVEFVNKSKSTSVVALKILHVFAQPSYNKLH